MAKVRLVRKAIVSSRMGRFFKKYSLTCTTAEKSGILSDFDAVDDVHILLSHKDGCGILEKLGVIIVH